MTLAYEIYRYAILASAHIISSLFESEIKKIQAVILFGSVSQFRATKESDIDLFIDTAAPKTVQKALRAKLNAAKEKWHLNSRALEFKLKGIENELSIVVGELEKWKELKQTISSTGIVLYGRYLAKPFKEKAYAIFSWERLGKAKGAFLNRIYGYKINKKYYPGLIEKLKGFKLGRGTIAIPSNNRQIIIDFLEKYKIDYSMYEVWK